MSEEKAPSKLFANFQPASFDQWKQQVMKELKGKPFSQLVWDTEAGFSLLPYYTKEQADSSWLANAENNLAHKFPEYGIRHWFTQETIEVIDEAVANEEALMALSAGADAINFLLLKEPAALDVLLKDIQLEYCAITFECSFLPGKLFDTFIAYVNAQAYDGTKIHGGFNFDPIAQFSRQGKGANTKIKGLKKLIDRIAPLPNFKVITICGDHFRNAGSNAMQELAFVLSAFVEMCDKLTNQNVPAAVVFKATHFILGTGSSYFLEIAKVKALRIAYGKLAEAYGVDIDPAELNITVRTSLYNKTLADAPNNMLRNTTEALAGITGGCDFLNIRSYDSRSGKNDAFSKRMARNISLILKEESFLNKIADPAAGSYYVDTIIRSLLEESWKLFNRMEDYGGYFTAFENGIVQQEIERHVKETENAIALRKKPVVGVNYYADASVPLTAENQESSQTAEKRGIYVLQTVFLSSNFEDLRHEMAAILQNNHGENSIFKLLIYQNNAVSRARAAFSQDFLAAAGIVSEESGVCQSIDDIRKAIATASWDGFVLCATDEDYAQDGESIIHMIRECCQQAAIVIAGDIGPLEPHFKNAGMDFIIHRKSNAYETLKQMLAHISKNKTTAVIGAKG